MLLRHASVCVSACEPRLTPADHRHLPCFSATPARRLFRPGVRHFILPVRVYLQLRRQGNLLLPGLGQNSGQSNLDDRVFDAGGASARARVSRVDRQREGTPPKDAPRLGMAGGQARSVAVAMRKSCPPPLLSDFALHTVETGTARITGTSVLK